ncbi:stage III sporulation protein SpoAB [Bacillus luteolus]|uniref:Stage III sporulation protein SpoAB n=1 Tax=Litchfieldia luteola TaxID=682179 RepID=A0ABR9QPM6_9BACI|nr:stage III sporulation protein SpoIIIAB [Cytobacillus luteolus]MBE4910459.1 stage III sporulation protein SpoAB [Cytobacillus luteolus]MBP1941965.1 stage III sporulation protein AB [Cytobacillus luteolus]
MKLLGAIIILVAATWTGFEAARHLSERPRQLRQLKAALQALEAEIMYGHVPLHEAAIHLAKQMPKPLTWFFEGFAKKLIDGETSVKQAWDKSLEEVWKFTALKQGEQEVLKQFGETLGQHDRNAQQKHIILALTHLEREESEAREKQARYEKMVKSLGFLTGLLLVILLM